MINLWKERVITSFIWIDTCLLKFTFFVQLLLFVDIYEVIVFVKLFLHNIVDCNHVKMVFYWIYIILRIVVLKIFIANFLFCKIINIIFYFTLTGRIVLLLFIKQVMAIILNIFILFIHLFQKQNFCQYPALILLYLHILWIFITTRLQFHLFSFYFFFERRIYFKFFLFNQNLFKSFYCFRVMMKVKVFIFKVRMRLILDFMFMIFFFNLCIFLNLTHSFVMMIRNVFFI